MQTYILLTKLSTDLSKQMKDRQEMGRNWLDQVRKQCPEVKFLAHYALLGHWDFMDIYEAPDEDTAVKVSIISRSYGAHQIESWPAIPFERILKLTGELDSREKK